MKSDRSLFRIELITASDARVWHVILRDRLRKLGHEAWLRADSDASPVRGLKKLAAFETRAYRPTLGGGESAVSRSRPAPDILPCDLSIDLVGSAQPPVAGGARRLVVLADGATGEAAMLAPLLVGRAPELVVALRQGEELLGLSTGLPALEEPHLIVRSLDRVCARLVDLVLLALRTLDGGDVARPCTMSSPVRLGPANLVTAALRTAAGRLRARSEARGRPAAQWRIAWRAADDDGSLVRERLAWPQAQYEVLPDDGQRYYADPFLIEHAGRCWLFCEEFPYATGRGVISAVEMGPQGPVGEPRPVLEEHCHLSYPHVFAHDGTVYMVPETSGRGSIELWRAERMPDRWIRQATLLDGLNASDASVVRHDGRWWIFATVGDHGQSSWDTLAIFFSERLEGPWRAHPANPALIDARTARPAGRMFRRRGELWRPVQDCTGGYGSALGFARVTELTPVSFAQEAGPALPPPPAWGSRGVHTLDSAAGFEVIDVFMPPAASLPAHDVLWSQEASMDRVRAGSP